MRMRENWDIYLISQIHRAGGLSESGDPTKCVLSTYPPDYQLPNHIPFDNRPTYLVPSHFDPRDQVIRQKSRKLCRPRKKPLPNPLWAAGFSFSFCDVFLKNEIFPPHPSLTHHLFFGEEIYIGLKLFLNGIECFCPPETVLFHMYDRSHRPSYFSLVDRPLEDQTSSLTLLLDLIGSKDDQEISSSSDGRTVQEWLEKVGVESWEEGRLISGFEFGGLGSDEFADEFTSTVLSLINFSQQTLDEKKS